MRVCSGHDPSRYRDVARWPLREALLAYRERLRQAALIDYRAEVLRYTLVCALGGKTDKPVIPAILKG